MNNAVQFINNQWLGGEGKEFTSLDPVKNTQVWQGQAATAAQVDMAVQMARKAQYDWAGLSFDERVAVVKKFAEQLTNNKEAMALTIASETGKALWEARTEVAAMIGKIDISVRAYQERTGTKENPMPQGRAFIRHKPHGVVAVFGPYNFPGHLPNGHIVPALIAGNAVLFKPSELTPLVGELMAQAFRDAGLPDGIRVDVEGNIWSSAGDGVHCFAPDGTRLGKILVPETVANLTFGGPRRNRLFITATRSLYAVYTTASGAQYP